MAYQERKSSVKQILDDRLTQDAGDCGLIPIAAPTKIGKSYAATSYIADMLCKHGPEMRRVLVTTNMKRNLPIDDLERELCKRGRPELMELVGNLDANNCSIINNLPLALETMSDKPYRYLAKKKADEADGRWTAQAAEFDIVGSRELDDLQRAVADYRAAEGIPRDQPKTREVALQQANKAIAEADRRLRNTVYGVFLNMVDQSGKPGGNGKLVSRDQRFEIVRNDPWWEWLRILYPGIDTRYKRVLYMSVDKLLVKNVTVLEKSETIIEGALTEGSILFIDEWELSKEVIKRKCIKDSVDKASDSSIVLKRLFEAVTGIERTEDMPCRRILSKDILRSPKDKKDAGAELEAELGKIEDVALELFELYHLDRTFKLADAPNNSRTFLFRDHHSDVIASGSNNWVGINFGDRVNEIVLGKGKPPFGDYRGKKKIAEGELYPVALMLSRIEGVVGSASRWVARCGDNHARAINELAKMNGSPEITAEDGMSSVLEEFNITDDPKTGKWGPVKNTMMMLSQEYYAGRGKRRSQTEAPSSIRAAAKMDSSLMATGLQVYAFTESPGHNTTTRFEHYGITTIPEKVIVNLAQRCKVVALSATLDIPTVLGNYNMEQIAAALGDGYQPLTHEDRKLIADEYALCNSHSDEVEVECRIARDVDESLEYKPELWAEVLSSPMVARKAANIAEVRTGGPLRTETHAVQRLLKLCMAYRWFWSEDDAYAALAMLNKLPRHGDETFDKSLVSELFAMILEDIGVDLPVNDTFAVLGGADIPFDEAKDAICADLGKGAKLFVITCYKSTGAGQNLQYPLVPGRKYVQTNDFKQDGFCDIDFLYLEKPTYTSPVITPQGRGEEPLGIEDALRHCLDLEYLYDNCEIDRATLKRGVSCGLKSMGSRRPFSQAAGCESAAMKGAQLIAQACGRINRMNMKNPKVRIMCDWRLMEGIDLGVLRTCGLVFSPEMDAVVSTFENMGRGAAELENSHRKEHMVASRAHQAARGCILSSLTNSWDEVSMAAWEKLRDDTLRHPTMGGADASMFKERHTFYCKMPTPRNSYLYTQENDYETVKLVFEAAPGVARGTLRCSEKAARLDQLMEIPGLREHFAEHGYATEWASAEWIMEPMLYNNIYKGALGEVSGRFCIETFANLPVESIEAPQHFEKFDFIIKGLSGDIYVDFKHWRKGSDPVGWDAAKLEEHIFKKMADVGADRAIVANVLPPDCGRYRIETLSKDDTRLLIVPSLVDASGKPVPEAIARIRGFCR